MRRHDRRRGVALGLLCAGASLGVAEVAAVLVGPAASPVEAVGAAAIDLTPEWLKSFAIRTFGPADKVVLIVGIALTLGLVATALGWLAWRRASAGVVGLVALGALGAAAAISRPEARPRDLVPSLVGVAAGVVCLRFLRREGGAPGGSSEAPSPGEPPTETAVATSPPVRPTLLRPDRRAFLRAGLRVGGLAVVAGVAGRAASSWRFDVAESRSGVDLPAPGSPAAPIPEGAELGVDELASFITPNDRFYRVDISLFPPGVSAEDWRLRIHGMVDREIELGYDELLARPMLERDITLACVSNEVGGPYVGNARWLGAALADLLEEAGVQAGADQMVSRAVDGFTIGTPTAVVTDGRDALLAVGMNGEPLPVEHGFPVRMVVPGLYGYTSAMKWITEIELTTFDAYDAYWVERGWAREVTIETMTRVDTPRSGARRAAGQVPVAGVAWAQHRGIEAVEVRVDGGAWHRATLGEVTTVDTWRQWVWTWDATPGEHRLEARAIDGDGQVQTHEPSPPFPDGATGWHTVSVGVD